MIQPKDVVALIPTPLTDEGKLDEKGLRNLIDFELENGCSGVGVLAAIGEGYLFTREQRAETINMAVKHMNGRASLMVGCPAMGTATQIQLCKEAEDLGADAILAFNPQGMRFYTPQELLDHYRALTDAVKICIAPYSRLLDPIPLEVLETLVNEKRASCMKFAWSDYKALQELIKRLGDRMTIFCGADDRTLRYLRLGCPGILTATAGLLPKENVELLAMVRRGDIETAYEYYYDKIMPWNDQAFYDTGLWQAIHKAAFYHMGLIDSMKVMLPQASPAPWQYEELKLFLKRQGKLKR